MTITTIRAFAALLAAWIMYILAILYIMALPAIADPANCGPHDRVLAGLLRGYGEVPVMIGLGPQNRVVEITASADTGTWTILVSTPEGQTCLVTSGQSFELIPWPPPGVPS